MAPLSASVTLLVVSFWVQLALIHGQSCKEQGLLSCQFTKECYKPVQRCDGSWDCSDRSDEAECSTDPSITKEGVIGKASLSKGSKLAWLITPILLLLGAGYGIYKCVKDGVCGAMKRRLTQNRRTRESRASDYHPLHQVSFYTSTQIPCNQLGINPASLTPQQQQLMLVHNQSFSIQIQGQGTENLGVDGAVAGPPTYEEAMSAVSDGKGGTIVMMKNGRVIAIPQVGILPPPYANASTSRSVRVTAAADGHHMEAIEEVEEMEEEEQEEEDHPDNADEQTFFLPKDSRGDGNVGGRRRHHSQWSNKQRSESRRRHHSCPS